MQERPDFKEVLECVGEFLQQEAAEKIADPHLRFRMRIAANLLAILQRELEQEPNNLESELKRLQGLFSKEEDQIPRPASLQELQSEVARLNARLAEEIRTVKRPATTGDPVWTHARQTVIEKLQVTNPGYLKRAGV